MDNERRRMDDDRLQELHDDMLEMKVNQKHLTETFRAHTVEDHTSFGELRAAVAEIKKDFNDLRIMIAKDRNMILGGVIVAAPLITFAANHFFGK